MPKKNDVLKTAFDEYVLIEQIGQGGAGIVWKANNPDGTLAIKILNPNCGREKLQRFKSEIRFCSENTHGNIIKVLDTGIFEHSDGASPFYVMKLYSTPLDKLIPKLTTPEAALKIFEKILNGVEAAHLKGTFHRDLKPKNILCDNEGNEVVVSDFGIAHFEGSDLTKTASKLANFEYCAPEQKRPGGAVDLRADIYALGLMLHELITHQVPHGQDYPSIESVHPAWKHLDAVVKMMLKQDPNQRIQTVDEVKKELFKATGLADSFQKLNNLTGQVVSENDLSDDPVLRNPIAITAVDYVDGQFICVLNQVPPDNWRKCWGQGGLMYSGMIHPKMARIYEDRISLETSVDQGPHAKDILEDCIYKTNKFYTDKIREYHRREIAEKKQRLKEAAETERKRQEMLTKIKL